MPIILWLLGAPLLIAAMLVVFGVVLVVVDRRAPSRRSVESVSIRDGAVLGLAQAVALQGAVRQGGKHHDTSTGSPQACGEIPSQRRITSFGIPMRSSTRPTTVSTSSSMVAGRE